MELTPPYNIIKKNHPILEIICNYHTGQLESNGKLEVNNKVQRFIDVLIYKCGDIIEDNYELVDDDNDIMIKLAKAEATRYEFTCICTKRKCKINKMIRYKPKNELFLVGTICNEETFPRLKEENKLNRIIRKKIFKQHEKDLQNQKQKEEKDLQKQKQNDEKELQKQKEDYNIIKNMIVNFGKYKGQTFNDIDDSYVLYIIKDFEKIHKSKKLYYRVVKFFCNKIDFDKIKDDIKDDIPTKDAIKIIEKLYKINKLSKFYDQVCIFFSEKFNLQFEDE